jgi:hypothetical protein
LIDALVSAVVFLPRVGGTISFISFIHFVVGCVWSVYGGRNLIGESRGALGGKARARVESKTLDAFQLTQQKLTHEFGERHAVGISIPSCFPSQLGREGDSRRLGFE